MTTQQALDWMNGGWRNSKYARTIPGLGLGIDVDKQFGFQCKDFANGFADFMGNPFGGGNAIALWLFGQPGWHKVGNPQIGDVFVRNYTAADGVNYGDTGVVKEVIGNKVRVVQQNLAGNLLVGSPPAERVYDQSIMLGYLRNDNIGDGMEMFNDGDRTTWLREASVTDVGQYSELVGKVSFKKAVEKMRNDGLFRPNPGDVVNGFNIFHAKPSDTDTALWIQRSMKDFLFEKVADGVTKMPPAGVKPYDGPQLLVES